MRSILTYSTLSDYTTTAPVGPSPSGWPLMYACDMDKGFTHIADLIASSSKMQLADAFHKAFPGHKYVSSTFSDNRKWWRRVKDTAEGEAIIKEGRTNPGLWSRAVRIATSMSSS